MWTIVGALLTCWVLSLLIGLPFWATLLICLGVFVFLCVVIIADGGEVKVRKRKRRPVFWFYYWR